jgi:hypothetical protein
MAAVNIVNVTTINGITTGYTPSGTSAVVLLPNAASSGNVFKIDQVMVANLTSSAATATLQYYSNGAVAQGSAPSGGSVVSSLAYQISVPPNSSVILSDKTTAFYLVDGNSITVTSGTGSALSYTVSYELIS